MSQTIEWDGSEWEVDYIDSEGPDRAIAYLTRVRETTIRARPVDIISPFEDEHARRLWEDHMEAG